MSWEISDLEIQVMTTAASASAQLNSLVTMLEKVRTAAKGGAGLGSTTNSLAKLDEIVRRVSSTDVGKLNALTTSLQGLSVVKDIKISPNVANQLSKIDTAVKGIGNSDYAAVGRLVEGLKPLSQIEKSNLGPTLNQLSKLPKIVETLDNTDIGKFSGQIKELTVALAPLADQMSKVSAGFALLPRRVQQVVNATARVPATNNAATRSYNSMNLALAGTALRFGAVYAVLTRAARAVSGWIDTSNKYVEDLNLFTASMGKFADASQAAAEHVGELMGIDPAEWMRNQGVFQTLISGFGVASDRAEIMSRNLTQLGYDLGSFYNISFSDAMQKIQSGISGELEPLRRLGYDLSKAKLEAVALSLGIEKSFNAMTQAEKAQLRYHAILNQVTVAQGDMARSLEAPANQLRILQSQATQASRALGNIFIPALNAILPYAIAFLKVIRWVAQEIANLFGFSLPEIDYSGITDVTGGVDDLEGALDDASGAASKLKGLLAGFDQLNIIQSQTGGGKGGGAGGLDGFDFDLPEYDFLGQLTEGRVNEIVKNFQDAAKGLIDAFQPVIDRLSGLWNTLVQQFSQHDWLSVLTTGLTNFAQLVGAAFNVVLSAIIPVLEGLNIPQIVFSGLELLNSLMGALRDILNAIQPGIEAFSETFLRPVAEWAGEKVADALGYWKEKLDSVGEWAKANEGTFTGLFSAVARWGNIVMESVIQPLLNFGWDVFKDRMSVFVEVVLQALVDVARLITAIVDLSAGLGELQQASGALGTFASAIAIPLGFVGDLIDIVVKALGNFLTVVADLASGDWDAAAENIQKQWDLIGGGIIEAIKTWAEPAMEWFKTVFDSIGSALNGFFGTIGGAISSFFSGIWDSLTSSIAEMWEKLKLPVALVLTAVDTAWNGIKALFTPVIDWFVKNVTTPLGKTFIAATSAVSSSFSTAWESIKGVWNTVSGWFKNTVTEPLKALVSSALSSIKGFFTQLWTDIKTVFANVKTWFETNVGNPIADVFKGIVNAVVNAMNGLIDRVNSIQIKVPDWVSDLVGLKSGGSIGFNIPRIPTYSTGGFPENGLFFANSSELVGRFTNGKTAVANNEMIVDGIASGVATANEAQNQLLREQNQLLRALLAKDTGVTLPSDARAGKVYQQAISAYDTVRGVT